MHCYRHGESDQSRSWTRSVPVIRKSIEVPINPSFYASTANKAASYRVSLLPNNFHLSPRTMTWFCLAQFQMKAFSSSWNTSSAIRLYLKGSKSSPSHFIVGNHRSSGNRLSDPAFVIRPDSKGHWTVRGCWKDVEAHREYNVIPASVEPFVLRVSRISSESIIINPVALIKISVVSDAAGSLQRPSARREIRLGFDSLQTDHPRGTANYNLGSVTLIQFREHDTRNIVQPDRSVRIILRPSNRTATTGFDKRILVPNFHLRRNMQSRKRKGW